MKSVSVTQWRITAMDAPLFDYAGLSEDYRSWVATHVSLQPLVDRTGTEVLTLRHWTYPRIYVRIRPLHARVAVLHEAEQKAGTVTVPCPV